MWQRSLMHFLNFIFWISKFICKNCCRRKEICNHMLGSFYSRSVMWWSRPVRYTWRVDSSPLCAASAETMTFKYTFFSNLAIPCIFFYQLIQTQRASVRSRDKTTNPSRYCAPTRGKNGRAKKKKKKTLATLRVQWFCLLFFTRDFPFHALKYWSNTVFFIRGLSCGVDVYILSWLGRAKSSVLKPE